MQIKTTKLSPNFYTLEGSGGTIGVLTGPDGVLMVDSQFAPLTEKIVAAIKQVSDKPIRFMINTHVHGDHTGGNENLGKMGVMIIAREELRKCTGVGPPADQSDRGAAKVTHQWRGETRWPDRLTHCVPGLQRQPLQPGCADGRPCRLGAPSQQTFESPRPGRCAPAAAAHKFMRREGAAPRQDGQSQREFRDAIGVRVSGVDQRDAALQQCLRFIPCNGQPDDTDDGEPWQLRQHDGG